MKQMGANPGTLVRIGDGIDNLVMFRFDYLKMRDRKGGEISEFPEDLRVREFPL